jgi:glycosyltransferase involved in cell wall biosynthesis
VDRPLRILNVLGQRPGFTGSGVLVQELWRSGLARGDEHRLICAGYPGDNWRDLFGDYVSVITCSTPALRGELAFSVPGMSDAMPYEATRYCDLSADQVQQYVATFRRELTRLAHEFRPDLVHIHHLWVLTELTRELAGVPFVVTVHGTDLKLAKTAPQHRGIVVANAPFVNHVFCVSGEMRDDAQCEYGIPADKTSILGNGFNDQLFRVEGEKSELSGKVVLCAGKFVGWKGFRFAIRASRWIAERHRLVILGTGPEEQRRTLEREAADRGVNVLFPGHLPQNEVAKWMRRADVFVLPSIKEPFGLVLLEAMACGCRVVASNSGGPKDIIAPELVSKGLATLVNPLNEGDRADEERYERDLADAIQAQLLAPTGPAERIAVSRSISGMTWSTVYERMRGKYLETIGAISSGQR